MDYSAYNASYNTEVDHQDDAATIDVPNRNATEDPESRFDLLSFFATALQDSDNAEEKWTPLVLLSIHLGPWNLFQPWTVYSGTSFSVTLIPSKFLLRKTPVKPDFLLPRQLAVKTPRLKSDRHSSHNSKLLLSLAKEYQILKTELLASHENIVNAYGCCWQTLPTGPSQPMPSLILEGSPFGDVVNFSRSRSLTLRERLRLCLDVTSGLDALHTHGVIHGDLKLNNILVFNSRNRGYIAKLADFGSAILLSETTFPCRAPPGTVVYRAPECTNGSVLLRRDDLVKTDLFSLGVTLAFLLVGSHIVDEIITLSESDIQSLKEDNQLADWIVAHRHDRSEHAAARLGRGDWVTDPSWGESSLFADLDLFSYFTVLCNNLLAAEAHRRPESVETPAIVLRHMIRRHLQTLPPRGTATTTDPASSARRAALMSMSKARYRKLTGESVLSESRIQKEEVMAIAHCCDQPGSYLKEAKFIIEWNEGKALKVKKRTSMAQLTKRGLARKRPLIPARVVGLADKMAHSVEASIDDQVQQLMDLKIVSPQKAMFKPSGESNVFWTLPHPARELLANELLKTAMNPRNTDVRRADAAYEYAVTVLNVNDPAGTKVDSALELLTFAARNGHVEARASVGRLCHVFGRHLAASRDEEMEWLLTACRAGSTTAQRRFRDLDMDRYTTTMRGIRQEHGAICPLLNKVLLIDSRSMREVGGLANNVCGDLHESAITGNVALLLKVPEVLLPNYYECENFLGETPLVVACREGHKVVVEILLARGANAAHETACGVTPLHFLAAFDDDDIPGVASALLRHGADIEKVCEQGCAYKTSFDSLFGGQFAGSPLLWAVAAGNHCAVRTLLARGADPFAMEPYARTFSRSISRNSAFTWAAVLHQFDLLEAIVDAIKGNPNLRKRFVAECAEPGGQGYQALFHAMDWSPGVRVREFLLHGSECPSVALSCVRLLVESGVDPAHFIGSSARDRSGTINHPLVAATTSGHPAILQYMWDYRGGSLRPPPKLWITALLCTIFEGVRANFDFLVDCRGDAATNVKLATRAVKETLFFTNDPYFTVGILRLIRRHGAVLSLADAHMIFYSAVVLNHFDVARKVFETHDISLTRRDGGGETMLCNLISASFDHPNMERGISFFLSLASSRDKLFWNVGYLDNTGVTALQRAAYAPIEKAPASRGTFDLILEHFSEPKHLNAQLKATHLGDSAGYTALHLAVARGNFDAVASLVEKPGIETNLQTSRGRTPMDICVDQALHYQTKERTRFRADTALTKRIIVNMSILDILLKAENEGRISKYSTLLIRKTEDEFTLVDAVKGKLFGVPLPDLVDSDPKVSYDSRCLVEEAPIGDIVAFSRDTEILPVDLRKCIDIYWQARGE